MLLSEKYQQFFYLWSGEKQTQLMKNQPLYSLKSLSGLQNQIHTLQESVNPQKCVINEKD